MSRTQDAASAGRAWSAVAQATERRADVGHPFPCFAVDGTGLERVTGAAPEDQPQAPAMRALKLIETASGRVNCGVWDCQAGTFDVHFKCDEVVHILEGEVTVRAGDALQTLRAGDVALFREGLVTQWQVPRYVRKLFLHHFRKPTVRERIEYKVRMLLGALPKH